MFKPSKSEDSESPPMILMQTTKLLQTMETTKEETSSLKFLLEQKQSYNEQLQEHERSLNKSNAEKGAFLARLQNRHSSTDRMVCEYRGKGNKICNSCNDACQIINENETSLTECEEKIGHIGKALNENNTKYEKKIEELTKLLDQVTEKRKKKLAAIEAEEEELRKEDVELSNQLKIYENGNLTTDESSTSDVEELEKELTHLHSKLSILDEDYSKLIEEEKSLEVSNEEIEMKFDKCSFAELEAKFTENNTNNLQLSQGLDEQKAVEHEKKLAYQSLKDYEQKLDEELTDTTKFWQELEQNQYGGFSKIEQEIATIKADIIDRNEKYGAAQEEKQKLIESLKANEGEIQEITPAVDQIVTELKEVEDLLNSLKTSDDLSQQYNELSIKTSNLHNEKISLKKLVSEKGQVLDTMNVNVKKEIEQNVVENIAIENNSASAIKELEQQHKDLEATKLKLENDVKSSDDQVTELENALKTKKETIAIREKELFKVIDQDQKDLKMYATKKLEALMHLNSFAAPPPAYVTKSGPQEFAKPKTPEAPRNVPKPIPSAKPKRNWDSDSSMEGEELKLNDVLRKKHRHRQDPRK